MTKRKPCNHVHTPQCQASPIELKEKPCEGELWQSGPYFIPCGAPVYRCEMHAKMMMQLNPFGERYKPART